MSNCGVIIKSIVIVGLFHMYCHNAYAEVKVAYLFCAANPLLYFDPSGLKITGATKSDAQKFRDDIYLILQNNKFENIRGLFDLKGSTFKKISNEILSHELSQIDLTEDELGYITLVADQINSDDTHTVEYLLDEGDYASIEGSTAFGNYMNKQIPNVLKGVGEVVNNFSGQHVVYKEETIRAWGEAGFCVPTKKGSYSFITSLAQDPKLRAATSSHEVLGHGSSAARKETHEVNQLNAIRVDNLARRIFGLPQRNGKDHFVKAGDNPYLMPTIK